MNYFDFHCHLDDEKLCADRERLLDDMKNQSVGACTIGVDASSSCKAVALATACSGVWASVGQHPLDNAQESFRSSVYQKLIDEHPDQVVVIGECGLDYYWPTKNTESGEITVKDLDEEKKRQKLLFRQNISLAIANNLPLMLHVRSSEDSNDAHDDALGILQEYQRSLDDGPVKVVFHFFTGDAELAQQVIAAGYYISFPGVITFGNKVAELENAVRVVPLNRMFAETDSPYAAPKPHRGQINNPLLVRYVYEKIAEIRGEDPEQVRQQILQNVQDFYAITL